METLTYLINGIIGGIINLKISEILFEKKQNCTFLKVITVLIFSIILTFNYLVVDNFLKVIIIFIDNIMLNMVIYKERMEKTVVVSFVEYINILLSEGIIGLLLSIVIYILSAVLSTEIEIVKNTILLNCIILGLHYVLAQKLKNQYKNIVNKSTESSSLILGALAIIVLICMGSLFYRTEKLNWKLNSIFILDTIIIVFMGIVGILMIIQKLEYDRKNKEYINLAKYSEINATLLEEYSMLNHEHKNQLIIIKGMIEDKDKDLGKYVNSLILKKKNVRFEWIKELNNIKFQGLKSFINYKILEMKTEDIEISVMVSEECKEIDVEKLSAKRKEILYSIIGVYLDNAREATIKTKNKKVNLEVYVEDGAICFEIANTYNENIDISKINNYGYTSKGAGRGTGLYMIQNLIKNDPHFEITTKIQRGFFIQKTKIKI